MASKRNYACKSKVECLVCGKVVLSENQTRHVNTSHKGLKNVKFRFHNDAKQARLQFTRKDMNCNITLGGEQDNTEGVDDPVGTDSDESNPLDKNEDAEVVVSDTEQNDNIVNESDQDEQSSSGEDSDSSEVAAHIEVPRQPILDEYDLKTYGDQTRDFQASWYNKYPWIDFDTATSSVSCFPCKQFMKDDHFTYNNWKKSERLKKHSISQTHLLAMTKWGDAQATKKNQNSVLSQIRSQHAAEVAENRRYLQMIIESIAYLGKQNIAFRGHNENRDSLTELSDVNRGSFLELLSLRSGDSSFLKERLDKKLKNKTCGQWTSGSIQNEIIDLLASFVEVKIVDQIKSNVGGAAYIGVICDETSDISRHEQVSLVLSYIDESGQKRESFLKFIKTEKTDGETLFQLISDAIKDLGLDLSKIVGLGFDGAANMSGPNRGVATRFKDVSPLAVYIHCYGHLLNLAVKDCLSSLPLLRNTLGTIQSLYDFLEASPKRHAMFINAESSSESSFVRTLKSLSVTRWSAHYESVKAVDEEFGRIVKCLWQIVEECDAKASAGAKSLLIAVLDFEFIFGLSMLKIILPGTSRLSSYIQGTTIDIRKVRQNAELTIKTLESCRNDESFKTVWQRTVMRSEEIKEIIEAEDIEVEFRDAKLPNRRPSRRQQSLVGESSAGNVLFEDLQSYQRVTNYYPAMDKIITELKNRFAENDQDTLCALESVIHDKDVTAESFTIVSEFYSLDLDLLKAEHKLYCHFKVPFKDMVGYFLIDIIISGVSGAKWKCLSLGNIQIALGQ